MTIPPCRFLDASVFREPDYYRPQMGGAITLENNDGKTSASDDWSSPAG
jgi:hypothetical protein